MKENMFHYRYPGVYCSHAVQLDGFHRYTGLLIEWVSKGECVACRKIPRKIWGDRPEAPLMFGASLRLQCHLRGDTR